VLAPWAVLGVFVATWSEPRYPPAPMKNANGAPALVDGPAPDATKLGAQFELPLVVDAARVAGPDPLANLDIDLYFRRTGPLPRTTGVFVHIERRAGQEPVEETNGKEKTEDRFDGDHQIVGGSFYLSDAPLGQVVQDAFGVHVGKATPGRYDVWLGFGHVSGRRGRAKVTEPGKAAVDDNRIRIGSFVVR